MRTQPYNSIHDTRLWVKVRLQANARALFITQIQTRNVLLRSVVTRKNPSAFKSSSSPNSQGPDSPKKNERLVRMINIQRMPRRVDLQYSSSPVLRTDPLARSRRSRSRWSRRTVSLWSSSASCFSSPLPTQASRAGSCDGGGVHTPAGRCLPVVVTGSVEALLRYLR